MILADRILFDLFCADAEPLSVFDIASELGEHPSTIEVEIHHLDRRDLVRRSFVGDGDGRWTATLREDQSKETS